ncbi:MAG TPA: GMC family oxidoreductase [Polyangiaceae bacterium]|nr:GMC family oxidoreductase [Polyangiaceae bacterium]
MYPDTPVVFPDESLPEGAVIDGESLTQDGEDAFDYVVVGSGAAGAVAAHALASAGWSVGVVEEGPWVRTREFGDGVYAAFTRMFRDAGTQVMEGRSYVPLLQGRCVGGSTVVNSAIAHRTPEDVLDAWAAGFGLGDSLSAKTLEPHFEALERELSVHAVGDEALGENNRLFLDEARQHGLPARRMHRYEKGCRGSARCFTGCPNGAKQGMNISYVPWSLARGARIYCSCRVERVVIDHGRARGVIARTGGGTREGRRIALHARRGVLVAASTVQTPNLLRRSGLRARAIGQHFQCHPGVGVAGVFDAPVEMGFGATQGAESVHLRRTDRIKLETLSIPPELAAVRIPGIGHELMNRFGAFSHLAMWAVVVRAEAEGTVRAGWGGRDKVKLSLTRSDVERARKGLAILARMMFEAGAREVWPGLFGVPSVLKNVDEVRLIDEAPSDSRAYGFITTHLFGAARMGVDPRTSVVGPDFQTHEAAGLYVLDSSVFPTNLGVNPQHSIMAMSRLAATRIAESRTGRSRPPPASTTSAAA